MKLKGIGRIEQHIEKIFLGVVALALLVIVALQFVRSPNAVDAGGGNRVGPGDIYRPLERDAQTVASALTDPNPSLPDVRSVDLVAKYEAGVTGDVSPEDRLATAIGWSAGVEDLGGVGAEVAASGPVAPLPVPVLESPVADARWSTVDPYFVSANAELMRPLVGTQQPYDLASVSVEASFGGVALRDALLTPGDGLRAIPRKLWGRGALAVLGVQAERQRQNADGSWSAAEPVATPLGLRPSVGFGEGVGVGEVSAVVRASLSDAGYAMRPRFIPTVAGPEWYPPSEADERAASAGKSEIDLVRERIERTRQDIDDLRRAQSARPTGAPDPGSGRSPSGRPNAPSTNTAPRQSPQERRLREREEQLRELEARLRELEAAERGAGSSSVPLVRGTDILAEERVSVWAHDLRAEPGAVYRYRLRLVMNNPLFQQNALLDVKAEGQAELASEPLAVGGWSAWTDPVLVGPRELFVVTAAAESGSLVGQDARATVEAYRMFYGYYRRATVALEPGDAVRATVKLPENLVTFETGVAASQAAQSLATLQPNAPAGRSSPSAPAFTPDDRTMDPRLAVDLGASAATDPAPTPAAAAAAGPLGAGLTAVGSELVIDLRASFLDAAAEPVAASAGEGDLRRPTAAVRALFRGPDGSVLVLPVVGAGAEDSVRAMATSSASQAEGSVLRLDPSAGVAVGSGATVP